MSEVRRVASVKPKLPSDNVLGPAIQCFGLVLFLPKPYRHHDIMRKAEAAGITKPLNEGMGIWQGFMTTEGFMTRGETLEFIGCERSQIIGGVLTSEDLW